MLLALGEKGTPQVPFAASSGAGSLSQSSSLSAPPPTKKVDYSQPSFSFNVTVTRFRWILKEVRTRHDTRTHDTHDTYDTTRHLACAWSWRGA